MNFLRRSTGKQYDGPATDNADNNAWEDDDDGRDGRAPQQAGADDDDRHRRRSSRSPHGREGQRPSASSSGRSRRSGGRSSGERSRRKDPMPPPPGISSLRTSRRVDRHLPAGVMMSASDHPSKTVSFSAAAMSDDAAASPRASEGGEEGTRRRRPQVPMEHDGGVLCLCAVPDRTRDLAGAKVVATTRRFLSGGADGLVKLWEVDEHPADEGQDGKAGDGKRELIPRLARTYRGHSGYVHSVAVLGALSDPIGTHDHGGRRGRRDHGLTQSDHGPGLRGAFRRRSGRLTRSLTQDEATYTTASSQDSRGSGSRMSQLSFDSSVSGMRTKLLFVSASRDNTLRIWPIDDGDERRKGVSFSDDPGESREGGGRKDSAGTKLRGHQFGSNNIGGVLCVCAVPSLPAADAGGSDGGSADADGEPTVSAGQFCSGGSDGLIRVWDVQSAVGLKRVPRSGMYATVQLQCIGDQGRGRDGPPVAVTSLVCARATERGEGEAALFAGDARGAILRYGPMNDCGAGHVNGAVWWTCTAKFAGHVHPITDMSVLSSPALVPLLCPDVEHDDGDDEPGTMLMSSCEDGSVRVWDAFDARIRSRGGDRGGRGGIPRRKAMWEIELNDNEDIKAAGGDPRPDPRDRPGDRVGVTSLTTLQAGTLMAAGTTDGSIRMWRVSSGLYEGAYNLGRQAQVWSLGVLPGRDGVAPWGDVDGEEDPDDGRRIRSAGIIVSGDNRGRIRVLRKLSS